MPKEKILEPVLGSQEGGKPFMFLPSHILSTTFLKGCISTFFSGISAFFTISCIVTSFPSFQCNHCLREFELLLSQDWGNGHSDIQFVTGNSDLCHLVLSHRALKQRVPMQPHVFSCLLLCEAWNSLRLCVYPTLPGAEYPANAKRHFDNL